VNGAPRPPAHSASRAASGARLQLIGLASLQRDDGDTLLLARRDALLLARLALDGPARRDALAGWLWPDVPQRTAAGNLRQRLFRLRRWADREVTASERDTLRLASDVQVDLADAESALATNPDALRGDLLQDTHFDDDDELAYWLAQARARWTRQRTGLLAARADDLERAGALDAALLPARRLAEEDAASEPAHRRVIRLLMALGDEAGARAAYGRCRDALRHLADAMPDADTEALLPSLAAPPLGGRPPDRTPARNETHPLVGREAERRACLAAWAAHRAVLLTGEPGLGKSGLIRALVTQPDATPALAVAVAARPGDATVPYRFLERLLADPGWPAAARRAADQLRALLLDGDAPRTEETRTLRRPLRIRHALEALCRQAAAQSLATLALDDLQYADDASIEALLNVASTVGGEDGLHWLFACRAGEAPAPLERWLSLASPRHVDVIALAPLDRAAIRALVTKAWHPPSAGNDAGRPLPDLDVVAQTLHLHCGGNPLFLLATLQEAQASGANRPPVQPDETGTRSWATPRHVAQLLDARIGRLSPSARELAQVLALIEGSGPDDLPLATAVMGVSPLATAPALQQLERADVLSEDGRFAHDLVREACVRSLPTPLARHLHGQLAEAGAERAMPPAHVAEHAAQGGRWALAARHFLRAAGYAHLQCDPQLEARMAGEAARCAELAGDARGRFAAEMQRLDAQRWFATLDQQHRQVERLHACAGTDDERAAALEREAITLIESYEDARILDAITRARRLASRAAGRRDGSGLALSLDCIEAHARARARQEAAALALVQRHVPRAREALAQGGRLGAFALGQFGCALMYCNRYADAATLFAEGLAAAERGTDLAMRQEMLMHLAWTLAYAGDIARAAHSYERALELARTMGYETFPSPISRCILARTYKELGRFDEALTLLQTLRSDYPDAADLDILAVGDADLAGLLLWLGDTAGASRALRPLSATAPALRRLHATTQARIALARGRPPAEALVWLDEALAASAGEGVAFGRLAVQAERAALLPPVEGARLAEAEAACSDALGLELTTWPLRLAACRAWLAAGDTARAADLAAALAARFDRREPFAMFPPTMWRDIGAALSADGRTEAARQAGERARRWVDAALPRVPNDHRDAFRARCAAMLQGHAAVRA